jgi:hypothetical protein
MTPRFPFSALLLIMAVVTSCSTTPGSGGGGAKTDQDRMQDVRFIGSLLAENYNFKYWRF